MKNKSNLKNLSPKEEKRVKRKKIICTCLLVALLLPILLASLAIGGYAIWAQGVEVDASLLPKGTAVATFYDADGNKLDYADDDYVSISEVPDDLKNAFVSLEDKRFYSHKGYDVVRMCGALINNLKSGSVKEGASTITQQLVKNTHLSHERTLKRKLKEIAISAKLEKEYSKDEILAMYLSVIYFGNGAYGVKQASKLYFAKNVGELTLQECATLAGIVKNPSKYSPFADKSDCVARRNLVLKVMLNNGVISSEEYKNSCSSPLISSRDLPSKKDDLGYDLYLKQASKQVCRELNITQYQLDNSGYRIYTNLRLPLQRELSLVGESSAYYESDDVDGAIVLCDENGDIIALWSKLSYVPLRQAGSVLKPLAVYAPAINENVVNLATPIIDEPTDFNGYSPKNHSDKYYGETTIREGIKKSMNVVAVKTLSYLGTDKSARYLADFGINTTLDDRNYALALGATAKGVSPVEIAKAYSSLKDGTYKDGGFVKYVVKDGRKIYETPKIEKRVLSASTASIITDALLDAVKDGTARSLSVLPFEIAAKTGTAERTDKKNSDAWCASYNSRYTMVVWHGSDNGMTEKGGGYPTKQSAELWKRLSAKSAFSERIEKSADVTRLDVDLYATSRNKCVTLASEHTPLEYRKSEIFAKNQTFELSSVFEQIPDSACAFELEKKLTSVELSFDAQDIYVYRLYRSDIFGEKELTCVNGSEGKYKIIDDSPFFFDVVTYRLECFIKCNPTIKISSTKSVFVDDISLE